MTFGKTAELLLLYNNLLICKTIRHQLLQQNVTIFLANLVKEMMQTSGNTYVKIMMLKSPNIYSNIVWIN